MRKIFSIVFLLVFLFNIIGYYPVFLLRQHEVKTELSQILNSQIELGVLSLLSFDQNEIQSLEWIKKNEFRYKGEMWDIVMTEKGEDGKIYFYCFLDKKEKHLLGQLEAHVNRHIATEGRNKDNERNLTKNITKDYLPIVNEFLSPNNPIEIKFNNFLSNYHSLVLRKQKPPPKQT